MHNALWRPCLIVTVLWVTVLSHSTQLVAQAPLNPAPSEWKRLFNGQDLTGWKTPNFGGETTSSVVNGELLIEMGSPINGLTFTQEFPKNNYEIDLKAKRILGDDFFVALTFPVNDDFLTLIVGGWGGTIVGISSLNGDDANTNEFRKIRQFKYDQWYRVRLKVTPEMISVTLDDEQLITLDPRKYELSTRPEVDLSKPLGLATYETEAVFEYIRYREIPATQLNP